MKRLFCCPIVIIIIIIIALVIQKKEFHCSDLGKQGFHNFKSVNCEITFR